MCKRDTHNRRHLLIDIFIPLGPSLTSVPRLPGVHPSMGVQGSSLRYFWTISPLSLMRTSVLYLRTTKKD